MYHKTCLTKYYSNDGQIIDPNDSSLKLDNSVAIVRLFKAKKYKYKTSTEAFTYLDKKTYTWISAIKK